MRWMLEADGAMHQGVMSLKKSWRKAAGTTLVVLFSVKSWPLPFEVWHVFSGTGLSSLPCSHIKPVRCVNAQHPLPEISWSHQLPVAAAAHHLEFGTSAQQGVPVQNAGQAATGWS